MQLSSLTIGRRIALGFCLVLILLGAVAATAWIALGSSGRRLSLYAGSTAETNNAAGVESAMLGVKLSVNEFLATGSEASAGAYKEAKQRLDHQITGALGTVKDAARTAQLKEAVTLLAQYDAAFQRVVANTAQMDKVVQDQLTPNGTAIRSAMAEETKVPYTNGSAPYSSMTGSQMRWVKNLKPNLSQARYELR